MFGEIDDQQNFNAIEEKLKTIHAATTDYNSLEANKFLQNSKIPHNQIIKLENGKEVKRGMQVVKKFYQPIAKPVAQKEIVDLTSTVENSKEKHVSILTELKDCPNIITFYGTMLLNNKLYVISEWAEEGDLNTYLKEHPGLSWEFKLKISCEIASGLAFCHFCDILHHDIRSHNILLTENLTAKISNFRASRKEKDHTTPVRDFMLISKWLSPEKLKDAKTPYSKQCDIYSFSILLWELAFQKMPFDNIKNVSDLIEIVLEKNERPPLTGNIPPEYEEIMKLGWSPYPIKRPTADMIFTAATKSSNR
ncbi:12626_t:CDS:2, partial [Cetraspora pellucida]